jgi:Rieske Fe-S protein
MDALAALTAELRRLGGQVVEHTRVLDVQVDGRAKIITERGDLTADDVILGSGVPFLDRGLYFAKLTPQRSYAVAFTVPGDLPKHLYLSVDTPTRSLRTATHDGRELLLVGGNGHVVGRHEQAPSRLVDDLVTWTQTWFPGAERTHTWSAQDYQPVNHTPFVGKLPRGGGHVWLATGYSKWGMTGAAMAALQLTGQLAGEESAWATTLSTRVSRPNAFVEAVTANAEVAAAAVGGWVSAELRPLPDQAPAEGEAVVGTVGGRPTATATVDGKTCTVSAVCTHLGGIVRYNDLEKSWDCPLHGSRFAADGSVLEGPATKPLKPHDAADHEADGASTGPTGAAG